MTRRWFNIAAAISLIFLGLSFAGGIAARYVNGYMPELNRDYLTMAPKVFVTLARGFRNDFLVGRLALFNDTECGIYRGSMYSLGKHPVVERIIPGTLGVWCTTETTKDAEKFNLEWPGVYYRCFTSRPPVPAAAWQTCLVSFWYPITGFSVLPAIWLWKWHLKRKRTAAQRSSPTSE